MVDGPGPAWDDRDSEPGMWQQFRRRRVTRTVVLYVSFVVLAMEATLSLSAKMALPPWGVRVVTGAAVLGFPLMVVLAWTFDVTREGIVRTPDSLGPDTRARSGRAFGWLVWSAAACLAALALHLLRS